MNTFFYPERIAILGVADSASNLAKFILNNLNAFGYKGLTYGVGREAGSVYGRPIYRSLQEIPDCPDLAVVLVKAEDAPAVAEECGRKGIKRMVISSAGFSEYRSEKKHIEDSLMGTCRRYGIRLIGPNCLGIINMENGLFLPFGDHCTNYYGRGPVGIISQSGNVTVSYSQHLSYEKVGVSKAVSIGNKLDVDEVDLLDYYMQDSGTEIIFLYLESISRAREFIKLAVSSRKPIIIQKSNNSPTSRDIAKSHTNAMAADNLIVEAAFRQAGIIQVNDLEEMLNCVKVLRLPPMKGNRLACMTHTGGKGIMIADECYRNQFTLSKLPQPFKEWLQEKGRANIINLTNPIDLGDTFNMDIDIQAIEKLKMMPDIDGIFYNLNFSTAWEAFFDYQKMFDYLFQVNRPGEKPVYVMLDCDIPFETERLYHKVNIPVFKSFAGTFKALRQAMNLRAAKAVLFPDPDEYKNASNEISSQNFRVKPGLF